MEKSKKELQAELDRAWEWIILLGFVVVVLAGALIRPYLPDWETEEERIDRENYEQQAREDLNESKIEQAEMERYR